MSDLFRVLALCACLAVTLPALVRAADTKTVGPSGSTLEFEGGLKMVFPAGAVPTETEISVRPIRPDDLTGLYGGSPDSPVDTRVLGGFVAASARSHFEAPVMITVPLRGEVDERSRIGQASLNEAGDALKLAQTALPLDPSENAVTFAATSFSPHIVFKYARYLQLTSPDALLKLQMYLATDRAYTIGNRGDEGFLDLSDGLQRALDYLASRIGTAYDSANVFCAFDLTIVSTVISVDPVAADLVDNASGSTLKEACGTEFTRLYEGQPWINATEQNRTYTNTTVTPHLEKEEIYDIGVVAYIRPHNVQFLLESVRLGLTLVDSRFVGEKWVTTERDLSRSPIETMGGPPVVMPRQLSESVRGSYRGGTGAGHLDMEIAPDGWRLMVRSAGFAQKEDGRYLYLGTWASNPLTGIYAPIEVYARALIANPEERQVTVRIDHEGRCDGPVALAGPWQQQSLDLVPVTGNDPADPVIIEVYGAFGDDAPTHLGSKSFRYRDRTIELVFVFAPHYIRATDFFANQLKYRIECESKVAVTVSGLAP